MRLTRLAASLLLFLLAAGCSRKPAAISISPSPVRIYGLERSQRLTGRVVDKKGRTLPVGLPRWSSAKPEIVEVDGSGRLTAKGEGRTLVTAKYESLSAQVPVEVVDVREIVVSPASAQIIGPLGTQIPLSAAVRNSRSMAISVKVIWSSSNAKVASVAADGLVTSLAPGTTTAIARIGDIQAASEITVIAQEIARLEIRPATALVRVGDSQHFELIAYGPDGKAIEGAAAIFHSSNTAVATVDGSGVASGIAPGIATVRATLAGITAEATLLVN